MDIFRLSPKEGIPLPARLMYINFESVNNKARATECKNIFPQDPI